MARAFGVGLGLDRVLVNRHFNFDFALGFSCLWHGDDGGSIGSGGIDDTGGTGGGINGGKSGGDGSKGGGGDGWIVGGIGGRSGGNGDGGGV